MAQTVIGLFDNRTEAQQAVEALESRGFSSSNIDISNRGSSTTASTSSTTAHSHDDDNDSGIERFFKNLFGDDDNDTKKYRTVADQSECIVTVHAQSTEEAERAADILDDNGAVNVDERASQYGYGSTESTGISNSDMHTDRTGKTGESIEVIEENLEVGKREVQTGGVRLRSRIVERPVEESVRLREERVHVQRTPVNREVSGSGLENFQEVDIEMVEKSEVPVVNKQARVVEEVTLSKNVEERVETVSENLRRTEVDVEDLRKDTTETRSTDTTSNSTNSNF